jgi:tetratricopeptide (TPR) repeat protein
MLFDLTGKRKHVVRVVYAILALLMGGSLFLAVGPFNLAEVINTGEEVSTISALEDDAERIEERLRQDPEDEGQLLNLARTRVLAGNSLVEQDPETGVKVISPEAQAQFERGLRAWKEYLEVVKDEPSATLAQLVGNAYFSLAETSALIGEIEDNIAQAAAAQRLAAESQPSLNSLSTLAIYEYFNGNFAAADKAVKQAAKSAPSKAAEREIEKQLAEYRKRGKQWEKQKQKAAKEQSKRGREELEGGFGGLGGSALTAP